MRRGFTLVEFVIVIVILGIVAGISVTIIRQSTQSLIDNGARQRLAANAALINQQISRSLRDALPGSARVFSGGRCIEFMPVLAASRYTDLPVSTAVTQFTALSYGAAQTGRIAVYPLPGGNLYSLNNPGPLTAGNATVPGGNSVVVTLAAAHTFPVDSPSRRFFVVAPPETLCQQNGFLFHYQNYGTLATTAGVLAALPTNEAGGRRVVGAGMIANSLTFRIVPPTLQRNGITTFAYQLQDAANQNTLDVVQEVQYRNVP
ncbi:MSHA biogenesis protein MshO [Bacterioplanes sanyensis]|uniref:MSHA biogenesis protein MshO n=1 Tax=Bacterioplanes sanyensis TaxID=1249553 RepID=A0A222FF97_9GAMM|nr:prepilin-type N-terminal cleavage/methylation domain-containing protein [Bacterioplanes sanyensis]ASP37174.1 MSHA biogenesis protein MshO [Bacterioplanes sanyensis]